MSLSRRTLIKSVGAVSAASLLSARVTFAKVPTDRRLVVVILRGGLDGLAAVAPYGDSAYGSARGRIALGSPGAADGVLKLDGLFGLHPALTGLHGLYGAGELSVVHALATPYRDRSHFDGQDVLESGGAAVRAKSDGWLNRALAGFEGRTDGKAIAVSEAMPLILTGDRPAGSWYPSRLPEADEDYMSRVTRLYADHPLLDAALRQGIETRGMAAGAMDGERDGGGGGPFAQLTEPAGTFLIAEDGPRIAVLEAGGWDTHANQGRETGPLANRLGALDRGLMALKETMAPVWDKTAVLVVTEFGRTVAVNGTFGTDHGTGGAAFVLGGGVSGGKVTADWPGLRPQDLREGRDLAPTTDMRSLFKAALIGHLGLDAAFVEAKVFPQSGGAAPLDGLFSA